MSAPAMETASSRPWVSTLHGYALKAETTLTALVVVMMTSAGLMFLGVSEDRATPQNDNLRLIWLPVYLIVMVLAVARWRLIARYWIAGLCCLALVGWAAASRYWSIDPATTDRRVMALAFTTLFGIYLAAAYDGARFPRLFAASFFGMAIASLLTVVAIPSFGIHPSGPLAGDWRGVYVTKNTLALMMAIGGISCVSLMIAERRVSLLWSGAFVLCFFLLVMSHGATALVSLLTAMIAAVTFIFMQRGPLMRAVAMWGGAVVAILGGAFAILERDTMLKMLGKDPTLTGRTEIWDAVFRQVEQSPWLGFGFAAFWQKESAPARWIKSETGWIVPSAHNGWIDLIVQVGWIGAGLFAAAFLIACIGAIMRFTRLRDGFLSLLVLWIFTIMTLSESVILQHNSLSWALFITALARTTGPLSPERQA